MDSMFSDLYNLGTAIITIVGIVVYDVFKGGVKWYQSLSKLLASIANDPNRRA